MRKPDSRVMAPVRAGAIAASLTIALALSSGISTTVALASDGDVDDVYYLEEEYDFDDEVDLEEQASRRTTAPEGGNGWFFSGANPYYNYDYLAPTGNAMDDGKYVIGNCTWYAWGRAAEILGYAPAIGSGMPYDMVSTAQANGYRTGPVPADGALAVGQTAWGSWHVAVVEDVSGNVPYVSQSAYTTSDNWPGPEGVVFDYIPLNYAFQGEVTYIYLLDNGMTFDEVARAEREARAAELRETLAEDGTMYRLYNPYSGEHFYTSSVNEVCMLVVEGWQYEGAGWVAPDTSSTPVYRLYNPYGGDHHYTLSAEERDMLVDLGWIYEGVGWYSDDARRTPVYRQYNPYADSGSHNFTTSAHERDQLVAVGWVDEGIGWYALS